MSGDGHGEHLHLMSGTLDTSGSGGADSLHDVAVAFGAPTGYDALLEQLVAADPAAPPPDWEQSALFDPVTLQVLAGLEHPAGPGTAPLLHTGPDTPPVLVPHTGESAPPVPVAADAAKGQQRSGKTGAKKP